MDKILQALLSILPLWSMVDQVVQTVHDKGWQSVVKNSLAAVDTAVSQGTLSKNILQDAAVLIPQIVTAHPGVVNPVDPPVPAPVVAAPGQRTMSDADLQALAAILKG